MSKVIAICGSPGSGKTTIGLKLAQNLCRHQKESVLFVSLDLVAPTLGYLLPHHKATGLHSLGEVLNRTNIYREDVMKQIVTDNHLSNLGYLGFLLGENPYTYPRPTEDKIMELFHCLREIAEYVVIDCTSDNTDLLSALSQREADSVIQIISPDLKGMTYFTSNKELCVGNPHKITMVINVTERDLYLPIQEMKNHFKSNPIVLPYCFRLKQQMITGTLSEKTTDRKYREVISTLTKAVI